jgi:hypothetical protein
MTIAGVAGQVLTLTSGSTGTLSNPNVGTASLASLNNAVLVNGTGLASNYTVVDPVFSTVTISPAAITVGVNNLSKVYDTTLSTASAVNAPALQLKSGTLFANEGTGSTDTLSGGLFEFANANAGIHKTVNVSNASIVSGTSTVTQNYSITYEANTTSEITRAPIIVSGLSAANKVYDKGNVAVVTGTPVIASGLLTGDNSNISGTATAGTFAGANVGAGIAVAPTLSGLSLSNTNYYVAGTSIALAADITPAPLTVSGLSAANKIYDTTVVATLSGAPTLQGVLVGDSATVSGAISGSFASANKGTNLDVTADLSQLILSNSNYYVSGVTTALKADIAAAPIVIGGLSAADKVYNRNAVAVLTGTPVIASGLLGSDSATLSGAATAGTFADSNVGAGIAVTPTLTGLSLNNSNYFIAGIDAAMTAAITPASVTVSGLSVANKVYDATTAATMSGTPTAFGVLTGDTAAVSGAVSGAFVSADAGTSIAVTANLAGLSLSNSNYQITGMTAALAADIAAAPLTVTADNKSMVYGSTSPVLTYAYTGLVGGDTSASFNGAIVTNATSTSSVGSAYTITQGTLASSSANYRIATFNAGSFSIGARPLTVTVDAGQSKVYGSADPSSFSATIQTQGTDVGLLAGDTLGGSLVRAIGENAGAYAISSGSIVSANPNYAITFVGDNFAVTPRPITITANSGQTKVYGSADGALTYAISSGSLAAFAGVSDSLSGTLVRDTGNQVGSIYSINQGGLTSAANPNYNISYVGSTFQVTPRSITLTAPSINKVYDGSYSYDHTAAELAIMNQQLLGSDTFSAVKAVFAGNNPNVGSGKVITIDSSSMVINDGNSGRNYTVNIINAAGNITPASLVVTAANDAKFSVEADPAGYAGAFYKGFVAGETVANLPLANRNLQITRSDVSNNTPGTYTLTPGGHGAQGETVGNYQVSYVSGLYTILGPQDLLIRASAVTNYASTPTYQFTAKYISANGSTISYIGTNGASQNPINLSASGSSAFTLNDGAGGQLTTALMPIATGLSASGQVNAGQYNVTSTANPSKTGFANLTVVGSLLVEPMVVTPPNLNATALTKIYDGSTALSAQVNTLLATSNQLVAGDAATLSAVGTYDDKNVGNSKSVAIQFSISGADAANYVLGSSTVAATGNITPAPLTISAGLAANNKIYDATTAATISVTGVQSLAGVIGNDAVSVSSSGTYSGATFSQSNVGAALIVTPATSVVNGLNTMTGVTLTGAAAANYYVSGVVPQSLTANIKPKPITISAGLTASNKVYDAMTLASIAVTGTQTLSGVISSDIANVSVSSSGSYSGAFAQTNVGSGIAVLPSASGAMIAGSTYNQMTGVTLSGSAAGNYYVAGTASTLSADITPYTVNAGATTGPRLVAAANNKVYDTTATALGNLSMVGLFGGDSMGVNYSSAAFASANVNSQSSPQTVTFSGVTLSGASASNYTIGLGAITATANIAPAPVTISGLVAQNKVYTATTEGSIAGTPTVAGLLGSDTASVSGTATGTFASANVANGIAVAANLSALTLSNGNYVVTGLTAPLTANITPAPLTIDSAFVAQNKVYDSTRGATIAALGTPTLLGVLGSDAANLAVNSSGSYAGSFSQSNVGNGLNVTAATATSTVNGINYTTMAGVSLSGSAAANYYIAGPSTILTASIKAAPLIITAVNQASFVTQNREPLSYVSSGLLGSDTISGVSLTTPASSSQPVGNYAISASNATGAAMSNYQITYAPGTYTIVAPGQLLIRSSVVSTPYSTAASFANPTVAYATSGGAVINNLNLSSSTTVSGVTTYTYSDGAGASLSFNFAPSNPAMSGSNNLNAGVYGLTAANFQITGANITNIAPVVTGNLWVTPRALTITATPATYVYNGTVRVLANSAAAPGIISNDLVSITDSVSAKNVGNYFSSLLATGADAGNYQISYVNANLKITPYVMGSTPGGPAIVATAANRVYNTTNDSTGSVAITNLFPGDSLDVNFTSAAFNDANVANGKTVAFGGVFLSGSSAANYSIGSSAISATANITPAPVTIGGLVAANKQYDGTTDVVIGGAPTISGLLASDTSTLTGTVLSGAFASSNAARGIGVTANLSSLSLENSNYYITGVTLPLVANITPAPVTISGLLAANKLYDGTTTAVIRGAPTISGLLGSDTSSLTGTVLSGAFTSSDLARGIVVTANLSSLSLGNSNYYIAGVTLPLFADITFPVQTISNSVAVVQQLIRMPALTPAPLAQKAFDNKGATLYLRDSENVGAIVEAISVPQSGAFKFSLPIQILQSLIDMTGLNSDANAQNYKFLLLTDGATISVSAEDGTELPQGLTYSPASREFTVSNLSEVTLPIVVRVTITRQGNVVSTKKLIVSP